MQIETITARKAVDNAFLQETITEAEFETFRQRLLKLLNQADDAVEEDESEEHLKNLIKPFLSNSNFDENYYINTNKKKDLAIYSGRTRKSNVGVLIETKAPTNKSQMITQNDPNKRAFQQCILYYLRERIDNDNEDIKHIIITDVYHWYVFDAQDFERHFSESKKLQNGYEEWKQGQKVSSHTQFVYDHLEELVNELDVSIKAVQVDISSYRKLLEKKELSRAEQKKLVPLFKLFTPTHLLKQPFASDSNELNKAFYRELLYIMGLKEYKEKGTHYITRLDEENRQHASLIENTITQLESMSVLSRLPNRSEFGEDEEEQLFNVAIQLLITWINRILFLKLLEAQLYKYHREDDRFRFLSHREIEEYDDLNKLFFQVLAVPYEERSDRINKHFGHIPYLNSSLFDVSEIEADALAISTLEDGLQMPVYKSSKITDRDGQRLKGEKLSALEYLLRFLDAYNFNTEGTAEVQKEAKTLINASVLGRIFEKINGYKDGSFFTPGYITEYMCRETIRRAVVEKFGEVLTPSPQAPLPQAGEGLSKQDHPSPAGGDSPHSDSTLTPDPSPARRRGEQPSSNSSSNSHPSPAGGGRTEDGGGSYSAGWKLPESLIESARHLRKEQTEPEELLWQLLRNKQLDGFKFRRQHPIKPGFVLDFYCAKENLAIEIDGGYHNDDAQQVADEERTEILKQKGIEVIRFTNEQVLEETESVLEEIRSTLNGPHSSSLPEGERTNQHGDEGKLSFADIHNAIGRDISIEEANEIINSITICDPAVGSGHFLVSALNELIAIKSDLGILCYVDDNGNYRRFRDVDISVDNDELSISWGTDPFFEYRVHHTWKEDGTIERSVGPDTQRLQKALFREKNVLIENCLFGVDINPNSINICRLRLWIELLKHAYYKESGGDALTLNPFPSRRGTSEGERTNQPPSPTGRRAGDEGKFQQLEVLPNIDINIKQGNSLVSRFDLDADLSQILSNNDDLTIEEYKQAVRSYKETGDRGDKRALKEQINSIKESFSVGLKELHPVRQKLKKQRELLIKEEAKLDLFKGEKKSKKEQKKIKKTKKKIGKLEEELEELENATFYDQAFEWRFEFPEVLDEDGNFTGFDAVIGNPPYGVDFPESLNDYLKERFETNTWRGESYVAFSEMGLELLKEFGQLTFIIPDTLLNLGFTSSLRNHFLDESRLNEVVLLPTAVFESATVDTIILGAEKRFEHDVQPSEKVHVKFYSKDSTIENVYQAEREFKVPVKYWQEIGGFNVYSTEDEIELIIKLDSYNRFDEIASAYSGIKGYEVGKGTPPQTKEIRETKPYTSETKKTDEWSPFYDGKHIGRYENYWDNNNWIKYGEWLAAPRKPKIFEGEKILARKIVSDRLIATYIPERSYCNTLLFVIKINDDTYSYKFLLGILNSLITGWYYRKKFQINPKDTFPQILIRDINQLPVPDVDKKISQKIESLVDQILTDKEKDPDADTSDLEEKIDQLVYELYGLSDDEIEIVEECVEN